jgi:hypothetical protein
MLQNLVIFQNFKAIERKNLKADISEQILIKIQTKSYQLRISITCKNIKADIKASSLPQYTNRNTNTLIEIGRQ